MTVTVNQAGTVTLATLFSDNAFTPLANPFTSNTDGTYQFYTKDGRYDVVLTKTGFTFTASETADLRVDDRVSVVSPAQITANQNDYNPTNGANVSIWRLNTDITRFITGITAPAGNTGQRKLTLVNTGSFNINLSHQSGSSSAGNKFTCANGRDYALFPNEAVTMSYDSTSAVWRVPFQAERIIDRQGLGTLISNNGAAVSIYSFSVPGGLLGTSSRLRLTIMGRQLNNTGAGKQMTTNASYGGSSFYNNPDTAIAPTAANGMWKHVTELAAISATNSQTGSNISFFGGPAISNGIITGDATDIAVDSTIDKTLDVTITLSAALNTLQYQRRWAVLEWLP